ncbi:hypothetical protein HMPREF0063_11973 [Aeromicrobium marinum DSM 15272]|uniref:YqeB PH domain-containing protein n=1 Tax=Aeromicrobium marinum DSM 15272 TaxID=585531 RepID=E2SE37_9ACTN|nr:hypothetical protein [Aeromicrobium marinum]EFQ82764.1 hypothetical protein HMPREF0063_11973 [Aeromicrobium marinum DSM 15272]
MESSQDHDVLGMSREDRRWTVVLLGAGGAVLLAILPWVLDLLSGVPLVPFREVGNWVSSFDQPWAAAARVGVGLLAGVALALVTIWDEHRIEVHDDTLVLVHGDDRRTLRRDQVLGIHRDGKKVVVDGEGGRVLFARPLEAKRDRVREVFLARGWPWESN